LTGVVPASLCQQYFYELQFQDNPLQCYPECLLSRVYEYYDPGSTPVCDSPSTAPSSRPVTAVASSRPS